MRIQKKDLDPEIVNLLNPIESLTQSFTSDNGYLSYNGKSFYMKPAADLNVKKISDFEYINSFRKWQYKSDLINSNLFQTALLKEPNSRFRQALISPQFSSLFKSDNTIIFFKKINNFLYMLSYSGVLYKYDLSTEILLYQLNLPDALSINFDIKINPGDITDIALSDSLFISTNKNGIFSLNEDTKNIELKVSEPNVEKIEFLGNNLIVFSDLIHIYSTDNYLKTEKMNLLKHEEIFKIKKLDNKILILSRSYSSFTQKKVLHLLELDKEGISVIVSDDKIAENPCFNKYDIQWLNCDDENVYVSGLINDTGFTWKYKLNKLIDITEFPVDVYDKDDILGIEHYYENTIIYKKHHILIIKNGKIHQNIQTPDTVKDIFYFNGFYYLRTADSILKMPQINYSDKDVIEFQIDNIKDINEMELFIDGTCDVEIIGQNGIKLKPAFIIKYSGITFVNLPVPYDISQAVITLRNINNIDNIIIKRNRIFTK